MPQLSHRPIQLGIHYWVRIGLYALMLGNMTLVRGSDMEFSGSAGLAIGSCLASDMKVKINSPSNWASNGGITVHGQQGGPWRRRQRRQHPRDPVYIKRLHGWATNVHPYLSRIPGLLNRSYWIRIVSPKSTRTKLIDQLFLTFRGHACPNRVRSAGNQPASSLPHSFCEREKLLSAFDVTFKDLCLWICWFANHHVHATSTHALWNPVAGFCCLIFTWTQGFSCDRTRFQVRRAYRQRAFCVVYAIICKVNIAHYRPAYGCIQNLSLDCSSPQPRKDQRNLQDRVSFPSLVRPCWFIMGKCIFFCGCTLAFPSLPRWAFSSNRRMIDEFGYPWASVILLIVMQVTGVSFHVCGGRDCVYISNRLPCPNSKLVYSPMRFDVLAVIYLHVVGPF